jgi:hypothetical protein
MVSEAIELSRRHLGIAGYASFIDADVYGDGGTGALTEFARQKEGQRIRQTR